jgi:hypothetical protein
MFDIIDHSIPLKILRQKNSFEINFVITDYFWDILIKIFFRFNQDLKKKKGFFSASEIQLGIREMFEKYEFDKKSINSLDIFFKDMNQQVSYIEEKTKYSILPLLNEYIYIYQIIISRLYKYIRDIRPKTFIDKIDESIKKGNINLTFFNFKFYMIYLFVNIFNSRNSLEILNLIQIFKEINIYVFIIFSYIKNQFSQQTFNDYDRLISRLKDIETDFQSFWFFTPGQIDFLKSVNLRRNLPDILNGLQLNNNEIKDIFVAICTNFTAPKNMGKKKATTKTNTKKKETNIEELYYYFVSFESFIFVLIDFMLPFTIKHNNQKGNGFKHIIYQLNDTDDISIENFIIKPIMKRWCVDPLLQISNSLNLPGFETVKELFDKFLITLRNIFRMCSEIKNYGNESKLVFIYYIFYLFENDAKDVPEITEFINYISESPHSILVNLIYMNPKFSNNYLSNLYKKYRNVILQISDTIFAILYGYIYDYAFLAYPIGRENKLIDNIILDKIIGERILKLFFEFPREQIYKLDTYYSNYSSLILYFYFPLIHNNLNKYLSITETQIFPRKTRLFTHFYNLCLITKKLFDDDLTILLLIRNQDQILKLLDINNYNKYDEYKTKYQQNIQSLQKEKQEISNLVKNIQNQLKKDLKEENRIKLINTRNSKFERLKNWKKEMNSLKKKEIIFLQFNELLNEYKKKRKTYKLPNRHQNIVNEYHLNISKLFPKSQYKNYIEQNGFCYCIDYLLCLSSLIELPEYRKFTKSLINILSIPPLIPWSKENSLVEQTEKLQIENVSTEFSIAPNTKKSAKGAKKSIMKIPKVSVNYGNMLGLNETEKLVNNNESNETSLENLMRAFSLKKVVKRAPNPNIAESSAGSQEKDIANVLLNNIKNNELELVIWDSMGKKREIQKDDNFIVYQQFYSSIYFTNLFEKFTEDIHVTLIIFYDKKNESICGIYPHVTIRADPEYIAKNYRGIFKSVDPENKFKKKTIIIHYGIIVDKSKKFEKKKQYWYTLLNTDNLQERKHIPLHLLRNYDDFKSDYNRIAKQVLDNFLNRAPGSFRGQNSNIIKDKNKLNYTKPHCFSTD